jgi:hypothetical protein
VTATGSGTLPLVQSGGSGPSAGGDGAVAALAGPTNGTRAANAVNVQATMPRARTLVVGAPRVTLTYSGTATRTDTRVWGQLVDDVTGKVLGNLVTPIPVTLDGKEHTVSRPLEVVAETAAPGQALTLQLVANTSAYDTQRASGAVTFSKIDLSLPRVDPSVVTPIGRRSRALCLSPRSPVGPRGIGRIRLGRTRAALLRTGLDPVRRSARAFAYCVRGSRGQVKAVFKGRSARAASALVVSTASAHGNRRVRPGTGLGRALRAYPHLVRIGRGVYRLNRRSPRIIGVSGRRVRFVGVAARSVLRNRRTLGAYLRYAGVRR